MIVNEVDQLYELPPERFIAARDELAKARRRDGRKDDAKAIATLRRPTAAAHALNLAARRDPGVVTSALETGAELRQVTQGALAGRRGDLRAAQARQRGALDALVDVAVAHARAAGVANLDQLRRRATATVLAAVADDDLAAKLQAGRLDEDVQAPGFGTPFGFGDVGPGEAHEAGEDDAPDDGSRREAERATLEAEFVRCRLDAEQLEAVAATAEQTADEARRAADEARRAADRAAEASARARAALDAFDVQ